LVIADATPERRFVRTLCQRDNAKVVNAWLKNTPSASTPSNMPGRKAALQAGNQPDFFIKQDNHVFVVEIKADEEISDPSPENVKSTGLPLSISSG